MAHEARTDLCMWLGSLFLLIGGAGRISLDAILTPGARPVATSEGRRDRAVGAPKEGSGRKEQDNHE
jgi:hypothetical protein